MLLFVALQKHPAVTFDILSTIAAARKPTLEFREHRCTFSLRVLIVLIDIVDDHEHSIDHPRHPRPEPRLLAFPTMLPRSMIFRRRSREHDQTISALQLAVRESTVGPGHPGPLTKSEDARQPVQRGEAI